MKMMTGQDSVPARPIYGKPFNFRPRFKVLQLGNDIPNIYGTGDPTWRRTVLLPFDAVFKPANEAQPGDKIRINNFEQQLASELPGILYLLLKCCGIWQRVGLREPPSVLAKVAENRADQDTFGEWLTDPEQVEIDPTRKARASDLYAKYAHWARDSGYPAMSMKNFKKQMTSRSFEHVKDKKGHWYLGINPVDRFGVGTQYVTVINSPAPAAKPSLPINPATLTAATPVPAAKPSPASQPNSHTPTPMRINPATLTAAAPRPTPAKPRKRAGVRK